LFKARGTTCRETERLLIPRNQAVSAASDAFVFKGFGRGMAFAIQGVSVVNIPNHPLRRTPCP
jgi:hypothetical protein